RNVLLAALILAVMTFSPVAALAQEADDSGNQINTTASENPEPQETTENNNAFVPRDKMELSLSRKATYTVTIPEGSKDNLQNGDSFDVSVTSLLEYDQSIYVSVRSANGWELVDAKHTDNTIPYHMKINGVALEGRENVILENPYNAETSSVTLVAGGIEKPNYAGTYKDQLTFTIEKGASSTAGQSSG
ncbi:MAG: hypothetical protein K2K89_05805, partial [Ruminococcus sp.]|nr:hypothetical protein [Ruminococcus sp.]